MIELGQHLTIGADTVANIKVTDLGCISTLAALRSGWLLLLQFGLYKNDFTADEASTISEVDPCDFSGYGGLSTAVAWNTPAMEFMRAVTRASSLSWMHNGGPVANWVYGYYVVGPLGELVLAQRFADAPQLVEKNGVTVFVTPTFSVRSEF